ncbi:Formin-binding protein 1 [Nowakowskiella sp. JEL0407]|nr:Formin-binding protein 1 [Nowakowskiella sp. JEL0407]
MPFGHELWDQWREVEEYAGNGIQFLDKLTEFIRKRSEIEAEYSQRLGKLAKSYKDELSKKVSNDRISFTKAIQSRWFFFFL